jgi:hypothetical protein
VQTAVERAIMIFKNFAIVTLIAAPLIVLAVQTLVPHAAQPAMQATAPETPPPPPVAVPPSVPPPVDVPERMPSAPAVDGAAFGQPMPDAGKPFLASGPELPADAPPPPTPTEVLR